MFDIYCPHCGEPWELDSRQLARIVISNDTIREIVVDAHQAGQADAGVDPSYSNAWAYCDRLGGLVDLFVMPEYKSLEHASTVVVTTDDSELWYVLKWAERQGKHVSKGLYDHVFNSVNTMFCISTAGDMVGWTDQMDRSLYYKPFDEFLGDI